MKTKIRLDESLPLWVKSRNRTGVRKIPVAGWYLNRRTELGEDADIWERMPHGGRRQIDRSSILACGESQD